jgi:hypothetical protein
MPVWPLFPTSVSSMPNPSLSRLPLLSSLPNFSPSKKENPLTRSSEQWIPMVMVSWTKKEIQQGYLEFFGKVMSDEEVDEMFAKVDVDDSGAIDYSEFVVASMNEKNLLSNNKLQSAFKMFDKDGGGSISTEEIKQVLSFGQNLEESVVNDIIK